MGEILNYHVVHIFFELLVMAIEMVSVLVMLWGVVKLFVHLFKSRRRGVDEVQSIRKAQLIRGHLGSHILLGLELLIVSDVIRTMIDRTWQTLGMLAGIVAIRTALSYFLNKDISEAGFNYTEAKQ